MDKKPYAKIDPIGKLHIIYSLDNGQSKADIARVYGVHPQTIAYIYRQKELILKKYAQKYDQFKEVCCVNLDQSLLEWFKVQILNRDEITEEDLLKKAHEIIKNLNKKNIDIEDWISDFRLRHNIEKFSMETHNSAKSLSEWKKKVKLMGTEDLYIGGICALAHSLSLEAYLNGEKPIDHMSIFFIFHALESDKTKIAVIGGEQLIESNIGSLPVNYYCNNGSVNQTVILKHLKEWDNKLASEGKIVSLALHMPENCYMARAKFNSIRIVNTNMAFIPNSMSKTVECIKYHYRKLQITKLIEYGDNFHFDLLDYINMVSLACFSVPDLHIKQIFFPPKEGSLYIRENDACDGSHSLLHWCQLYNVPLNLDLYRYCLNDFISCDKDINNIDFEDSVKSLELNFNPTPALGMEAYKAMKRLLSYLQSEHASDYVLKAAKNLENHLEYGAVTEIHKIIDSSSFE